MIIEVMVVVVVVVVVMLIIVLRHCFRSFYWLIMPPSVPVSTLTWRWSSY